MTESFEIEGTHVTRTGDGPRHFLCIHGWGGGVQTFDPVKPHLPNDVSMWCIDLPGYGQSQKLSSWRYEAFETVAERFMKEFPPETFSLFGNCSGAVYGMLMVRPFVERCERMFLIDPFAFFPWYFRVLTEKNFGEFFYRMAFANPLGRGMTQQSVTQGRGESAHMTESFEALDHEVVHAYLRMMRQIPDYTYFGSIQLPTTLLIGERTFAAVRKSVEMWQELWDDCDVVELDAAHLPIQEATEALAKAVFG